MGLDDQLRQLLRETWSFDAAPPALLSLGQPALERLLDAPESAFWATDMECRDYGGNRDHAIAAFARADMDGVLGSMKKRKWTNARVAFSGIGLVNDARVVPFLVGAYSDSEPMTRARAVDLLACQRDASAFATVLRALKDRSSDVRLAAVRALGKMGDSQAAAPLATAAERYARSPLVVSEIKSALKKIRAAGKGTRG